jgi:hypothetical protein
MKPLILVAVVAFAFAQHPAKAPESQGAAKTNSAQGANQANAGQSKENPATQPAPTPQSANAPVTAVNQVQAAPHDSHRPEADKQTHDEEVGIQRKLAWFTGALVFVGALQVGAMIWQRNVMNRQLKAMQRQADAIDSSVAAAEKSADAARDSAMTARISADALIAIERAWVMVECELLPHQSGSSLGIAVKLQWVNQGKTPAWIEEIHIRYARFSTIPPVPDLTGAEVTRGPIPLPVGQTQSRNWNLAADMAAAGDRFVYGLIMYRDVLELPRETWFGYRLTPRLSMERIGHPEYNKYT